MANSDVRAAAATLDAAIQALDTSALEAAEFTPAQYTSYAFGLRFNLVTHLARLKDLSTEFVAQAEALRELE